MIAIGHTMSRSHQTPRLYVMTVIKIEEGCEIMVKDEGMAGARRSGNTGKER